MSNISESVAAVIADNLHLASADYPQHFKSKHWDIFEDRIEASLNDPVAWENFRNNGLSLGLDTTVMSEKGDANLQLEYTSANQVRAHVHRYDSLTKIVGQSFFEETSEVEVGRPQYVMHEGVRLNVPDMRLVYNAWRGSNFLSTLATDSPVIVEIGGGYGGLGHKLKKLSPKAKVILLDLPESITLQTYYLSQLYPEATLLTYHDFKEKGAQALTDTDYDFAVLPGWIAGELQTETIDLFINTRSLMEMNRATVDEYMSVINRCTKAGGAFYCVNRYIKSTVGEDIRVKDYQFDEKWSFAISEPVWDQEWIHELLAIRQATPNTSLQIELSDLPPHTWGDLGRSLGQALGILKVLTLGGNPNVNPGVKGSIRTAYIKGHRALVHAIRKRQGLYRTLKNVLGRG